MAFSGSQKTALRVYGIPGAPHSFLAKTTASIFTVVRFTAEAVALATLDSETMAQASFTDEAVALSELAGENLEN